MTLFEESSRRAVSPGLYVLGSRLLLAAALCLLLLAVLVFPFPASGRAWSELFNLAHAPLFFLLFMLLVLLLDPGAVRCPARYVSVVRVGGRTLTGLVLLLLALGSGGEYLQQYFGRDANYSDAAANAAGLLAGYLCVVGIGRRGNSVRCWPLLCTAAVLMAATARPLLHLWDCWQQWRHFPELCSFERSSEMPCWNTTNSEMTRSREWSSDGQYSLKIKLRPERFSGVWMSCTMRDWRQATSLNLTAFNPGDRPLTMYLKIVDEDHAASGFDPSDRFQQALVLEAGQASRCVIHLDDVRSAPKARTMPLERILLLEFFFMDLPHSATVFLDDLFLTLDEPTP